MHWFSLMYCILPESIWYMVVWCQTQLIGLWTPHLCPYHFQTQLQQVEWCSMLRQDILSQVSSVCLERRWCSATGDRQFINYFSALSLKWYIKEIGLMGFGSGASFPLFRSAVTQACNNFLGAVCAAELKLYNRISQAFVAGPKCYLWNKSVL